MMSETIKIALAGQEYSVRRLTLRQLRALGIGGVAANAKRESENPAIREEAAYDRYVEVIATALSRDNPEMTAEAILEAEVNGIGEVLVAVNAIFEFSGLVPAGEAQAAASNTATSTVA